jgi:hypothetical protein
VGPSAVPALDQEALDWRWDTTSLAEEGEVMAASGKSADAGDEQKPTFTFEQLALRVAVAVLGLVLLVTAIELGQVRGRVGRLETGGAPALAAATQDPLGSPQSFKIVLKDMAVIPKVVEVPAGTPLTLQVANRGARRRCGRRRVGDARRPRRRLLG